MSKESFKTLLKRALNAPYAETDIGLSLFRTCLETMHAAYMDNCAAASPSLELGIGDGSSSMFINGEFGREISVGLDMPLGMTFETKGLWWHPVATHYRGYIGGNMENIPFADNTFNTIYTSETMFYGMDLEKTASEIARLLKPGGCFYCFNATDAWYDFETVLNQLKVHIPSFSVPTDDAFMDLFQAAGLTCETRSYFFSPAMEILLHSVVDTGVERTADHGLLKHSQSKLEDKVDVLAELLAHEKDSKQGGFHHFLVFRKPGQSDAPKGEANEGDAIQDNVSNASSFDPFDHLKCPTCRATEFQFATSMATCSACATSYPVICGVPMMVDATDSGFSAVRLEESITTAINKHLTVAQKTAVSIFNQWAKPVSEMLDATQGKTLDLIIMAEHDLESKAQVSRQTASALRYLFKCSHPEHTISLRMMKESGDPLPPSTKSNTATFALFLSGGAAIPQSFKDALQVRPIHMLNKVSLNIVE